MEKNNKTADHKIKILAIILIGAFFVILSIFVLNISKTNKAKAAAGDLTVNFSDVHQHIDGFGASDRWNPALTDAQADMFFSQTNGIGLSILRVGLESNATDTSAYSNATKAAARGAIVWAAPWTAPGAWKTNGSDTNGGDLLPADYDAWATQLAGFAATLQQNAGVPLYGISVQNEPDYTASYESMIYTNQEMDNFVKVLGPKLAALNPRPKLIMPEVSSWGNAWGFSSAVLGDSAAAPYLDIIAAHQYAGFSAPQTAAKPIWETEMSSFEAFDPSIGNGLAVAQWIHDAIVTGNVSAWHYWWLIGQNSDDEGLIGHDGGTQITKRFYTMGNFSKFVRPGFYRVGTTGGPSGVSISAYKDPNSGAFAIVAINSGSSNSFNIILNGLTTNSVTPWVTSATLDLAQQSSVSVASSTFPVTLAAQSVTTFVSGSGSPTPPPPPPPDTIPPTVSLTAPTSGATISGTTAITANASDNVAVAGVQFKLDGSNLGSLDTTSPYAINWDSTTATNGSHTLTAVATDTSNNSTTSATVSVTVNNGVATPGTCQFLSSSTTAAFCEDLSGGVKSGGRAGDLDDSKWSVGRFVGGSSATNLIAFPPTPVEPCKSGVSSVSSDNDILVCDSSSGHAGQMETAMSAQNYAMLALRPRQAFDFAGRTGTITFNVDAITEGEGSWWPGVYVTDEPTSGAINSSSVIGMMPNNGIGMNFDDNCAVTDASLTKIDNVFLYNNTVETSVPLNNTVCISTKRGFLNHIEIRLSQTSVQIWASDYSTDGVNFPNFRQIGSAAINLPFTRGYVHFEQKERAPIKNEPGFYNLGYTNNYWSNLGFDGPVVTPEVGYAVPDSLTVDPNSANDSDAHIAGAMNVGYGILTNSTSMFSCCTSGGSRTTIGSFSFPSVNLSGVTSAKLTFSVTYTYIAPSFTTSNVALHYSLNGGAMQNPNPQPNYAAEVLCPGCPGSPNGGEGVPYSFPVSLSNLVTGTNTISFAVDNSNNSYPPVVANIDLLTFGGSVTPPPPPPPDTIPPTVSISAPTSGSTVSGSSVAITANASDNVAVAGVQFKLDGNNLGAEDTTSPYTINWDSTTATNGSHTLTAVARDTSNNTTTSTAVSVTVSNAVAESAFNGPHNIPGTVQTEDFDNGGEGVAYHDIDAGNTGGAYRTTDNVDIEATTDTGGGFDVGWTQASEWLKYTVNVTSAGNYDFAFRVASLGAGGTFNMEVDGVDQTGMLTVPNTGAWQTYTTVTKTSIPLTSGAHVLRLVMDSNGTTGYIGNFNYLNITASNPATYSRTISIASLDGRSTKVISGSLDVLNSSKGLIKTYAFTTNSSGTATITFDIPTQTVYLKIHAVPFLTRLLSNVDLNSTTTYSFPILLTGDINQDDIVNSIDFSILNSKWFTTDATSDLNQDGLVNSLDFSLLNKNWFVVGEQ